MRNPNNLPVVLFDQHPAPLGILPTLSIVNLKELWEKAMKTLPQAFHPIETRVIRVWTDIPVPVMMPKGERTFSTGEMEMILDLNTSYEGENSRTINITFVIQNIRTRYCESEMEIT